MTISAHIIQASRRQHRCDGPCGPRVINPREAYLRLYGRAEPGDPARVMRLCISCAWAHCDRRTAETVDAWVASQPEAVRAALEES